jgi:hypothetical protein
MPRSHFNLGERKSDIWLLQCVPWYGHTFVFCKDYRIAEVCLCDGWAVGAAVHALRILGAVEIPWWITKYPGLFM